MIWCFNTASVLIQPIICIICSWIPNCFNTASVLIQQKLTLINVMLVGGFNTASVLIQHLGGVYVAQGD